MYSHGLVLQVDRERQKVALAAVDEGRIDDVPQYEARLLHFQEVVHSKCGGHEWATTTALGFIKCVGGCRLPSENPQKQYAGRGTNDVDRFMVTHYPRCIMPNLDNPPDTVIAAAAAAKDRQGKNRAAATKSDETITQNRILKRKTREERDDQKNGRVKSVLDRYFKIPERVAGPVGGASQPTSSQLSLGSPVALSSLLPSTP